MLNTLYMMHAACPPLRRIPRDKRDRRLHDPARASPTSASAWTDDGENVKEGTLDVMMTLPTLLEEVGSRVGDASGDVLSSGTLPLLTEDLNAAHGTLVVDHALAVQQL